MCWHSCLECFCLPLLGYAGKFIEQSVARYGKAHHLVLRNIEYVLWAIVIGLVISNTVGVPALFRAGVATYEFWLKVGIVLLGARFLVGDVLRLGGISLGLVFVEITLSLIFMTCWGAHSSFGRSSQHFSQSDLPSAECLPLSRHREPSMPMKKTPRTRSPILALGAISLFVFPLVGHTLHLSDRGYGLWAGLAVDNTAEASAAGALYSDAAGKVAVLAKTCRNAMIGFVVLGYAIYWASKGQAAKVQNKAAFLWSKFPKFVLGFLVVSLVASIGFFTKPEITAIGNLSRWAFLLTFAGVGLRTNLRELGKQGARPFLVGAIGEIAIAGLTLGLVYGAARIFHL